MDDKQRWLDTVSWGFVFRDLAVGVVALILLSAIVYSFTYSISHADQKCVRYAHD